MANPVYTRAPLAEKNQAGNEHISFIDVLQVLAENLRLLVLAPLAIGIAALAISYLIPPTYTATATFLPPQQQQGMASSLLQSLGAIGGLAGAASGVKNPSDQYVSFLRSKAVEDALITRFNLMNRFDVKFKTDARQVLEKRTRIVAGKDNIIAIEFDDAEPEFSAKVANAYGEELTKLMGRLAITEAQQRRVFFGKQLSATKDSLVMAEQALAATGVSVSALNSNPSTALAGPAALRAQVTAQEVKLASMRSYLTDTAPEFRQAQAELSALRRELAKAETVQSPSASGGNDYIAKYRDFKYQETLFDLFSRQYEIARIDESREGGGVQIIDAAQPPEKKSKPSRGLIAICSVFISGFLLLVFVFVRSAWRNSLNDEDSAVSVGRLRMTFNRSLGRGLR